MWGFLYTPQLDGLLRLPATFGGHAITPLAPGGLLLAMVNIAVWGTTGYFMMLYTAGLSSIPPELYDAANIDGCSQWSLAHYVKIPLLRPTIILTTVLSLIGALQLFAEPEILSNLTTISASYTPNLDIYNTAFSYVDIQYSATLAVILGVMTVAASVAFLTLANRGPGSALRRPL
jgi:multiple sugar transport system permease protein